jgi:hypothetical protein
MLYCSRKQIGVGLLALFLAALVAEAWAMVVNRNDAWTAQRILMVRKNEWRRLSSLDPAPTAAQAARIGDELAQAEQTLAALWATLDAVGNPASRPDGAVGPSATGRNEELDPSGVIHRLREQARQEGVSVRPEETFGFGAISEDRPSREAAGPARGPIESTSFAIRTLLAARPAKLVSVLRPREHSPVVRGAGRRAQPVEKAAETGDAFDLDSRLAVREPGLIEARPIRLVFTGYTATLRRFLNGLLDGDHLVAVDEVTVEPADSARAAPRGNPAGANPVSLLVPAGQSQFTVTVECCELGAIPVAGNDRGPARGARTPGLGASSAWPEPARQQRGRGWVYEVFTPPVVFCNRLTRALAAVPAEDVLPAESDVAPPDLQLLRVQPGCFRYQLVGYAGRREDLHGIFADTVSGETFIGRAGEHVPRERFLLKQLGVGRSGAREGGSRAGGWVGTATMLDETTGDEVVLTTLGRSLAGAPQGLFASRTKPEWRRELKEGESIACNGLSYRVNRLELDPPLAVVECPAADGSKRASLILLPSASPAVAEAGQTRPATKRRGRTLATTP